ncbi:MAG TPA: hypothetical protein VJ806_11825, partial [Luteimonas sp.]|nr:hypothetical protein [Luteimonas sp.]
VLLIAWEWRMRALGLEAGDLDDDASAWAEQRRRIDAGDVPVAIVGDSRILFDTDLDRFQDLTGVRPVQLALPGTNARPFLQDLAGDADFRGLAIVGIAERSYFRDEIGRMADALETYRYESPSRRSGYVLHRGLEREFAFLDDAYRLSVLVQRLDPDLRPKARSAYWDVWKIRAGGEDRQSWVWERLERDARLREHARHVWLRPGPTRPMGPLPPGVAERTFAITREAVAKIRARGGEVVFVRPPSAPPLRVSEDERVPRAAAWDPLLKIADVRGVHFEDYPAMRGLYLPEWSHLSRRCSSVFTDAYVREIAKLSPRLRVRTDAPPPLGPEDCRESASVGPNSAAPG